MKKTLLFVAWLITSSCTSAQTITAAEYFIDTDAGVGNNIAISFVSPQPDGSFNFTIPLNGISIGYHKIYIRTRDSDGHWSLTGRRNIEVVSSNVIKSIIGAEYFFDSDPGVGAALPIAVNLQDSLVLQNFTATVGALSVGYHKLYIRTKDNNGNWSLTGRRNMEVINAATYLVAGAEYFFNNDPGVGLAQKVHFPGLPADSSFSFKIPIEQVPTGAHTLYIRAYDSVNKNWSLTQWETDSVVTSIQTGAWSQPGTWSNNKVPDSNTVVLLYHNVTVDIVGAVCKSLTPYRNNVTFIIETGKDLRITGYKKE